MGSLTVDRVAQVISLATTQGSISDNVPRKSNGPSALRLLVQCERMVTGKKMPELRVAYWAKSRAKSWTVCGKTRRRLQQ